MNLIKVGLIVFDDSQNVKFGGIVSGGLIECVFEYDFRVLRTIICNDDLKPTNECCRHNRLGVHRMCRLNQPGPAIIVGRIAQLLRQAWHPGAEVAISAAARKSFKNAHLAYRGMPLALVAFIPSTGAPAILVQWLARSSAPQSSRSRETARVPVRHSAPHRGDLGKPGGNEG